MSDISIARWRCPSTLNCGSDTSFDTPTELGPSFHLYRMSRIVYPTVAQRIGSRDVQGATRAAVVSRARWEGGGAARAGAMGRQALLPTAAIITCGESDDGGALPVAEHSKLRQLHFAAHADARRAVFPNVQYVGHRVSDSGDMPNTKRYHSRHERSRRGATQRAGRSSRRPGGDDRKIY